MATTIWGLIRIALNSLLMALRIRGSGPFKDPMDLRAEDLPPKGPKGHLKILRIQGPEDPTDLELRIIICMHVSKANSFH